MTPQIIHDPDDLNLYEAETLILDSAGDVSTVEAFADSLYEHPSYCFNLPAVVIASGEQVRAARQALEEQA